MLGSQDPDSPHGFVCYYTGLSPGAFKEQPLNYFSGGDPDVYATDYDTFTCDNATGLETQVKFADTIYSRDARGVYVNLFIPSELRCADQGITLRQTTGFPDTPVVRLTVVSGAAPMNLRVRVPGWTAGPPGVVLNGTPRCRGTAAGEWISILRRWQPGDWLTVTLPMSLTFNPAPDNPAVQAVSYGPVVLSGRVRSRLRGGRGPDRRRRRPRHPDRIRHPAATQAATPRPPRLPLLDTASVRRDRRPADGVHRARPDGHQVTLVPVARATHEPFTVYWQTSPG